MRISAVLLLSFLSIVSAAPIAEPEAEPCTSAGAAHVHGLAVPSIAAGSPVVALPSGASKPPASPFTPSATDTPTTGTPTIPDLSGLTGGTTTGVAGGLSGLSGLGGLGGTTGTGTSTTGGLGGLSELLSGLGGGTGTGTGSGGLSELISGLGGGTGGSTSGLGGLSGLAGLGSGTALPTGLAAASGSTVAPSADGCPPLELIFARGTTEPQGLGTVGSPLAKNLASLLPGATSYAVVYPASADFLGSAGKGSTDATARITARAKECPSMKFAIGGYSQGKFPLPLHLKLPDHH